ncbi:MAG: hypothetical protein IPH37_11815 [Burkholderiales bacterium]|nr:hypothetical protein [Burkholderiales bacterium]MBK9348117.1 hypothetical protein [Burkholderiales bacterium]
MTPTVVIPDSGPLYSLAAGDLLGILERFPLRITDVVKQETIDKGCLAGCSPEAQRLLQFYNRHARHIRVVPTQVGAQLESSRQGNPNFNQPRDLGELSIQSHLIQIHALNEPILPMVLFEDSWFFENRAGLPKSCILISTEMFLRNAEKLQIIHSAQKARQAIHTARPNASLFCCNIDLRQSL